MTFPLVGGVLTRAHAGAARRLVRATMTQLYGEDQEAAAAAAASLRF
jgi:hypothetical protein